MSHPFLKQTGYKNFFSLYTTNFLSTAFSKFKCVKQDRKLHSGFVVEWCNKHGTQQLAEQNIMYEK